MTHNASLRTMVLWRVLPAAAALLILIWLSVKHLATETMEVQVRDSLLTRANQVAETIDLRLLTLVETVRGLSQNTLVANGLVDAAERANYLPTFLQSLRLPGGTDYRIALLDSLGRTICANKKGHQSLAGFEWFRDTMAGKPHVRASQKGLRIAYPVLYSGVPGGVLLVEYSRQDLARLVSIHSPEVEFIVMENDNTTIFSSHDIFKQTFDTRVPGWLWEMALLQDFPNLLVVCIQEETRAFAVLSKLDNFLMAAMVLNLGALFLGIILSAFLATRPLGRFIEKIDAIHQTRDLSVRIPAQDFKSLELSYMAEAFNGLMGRITEFQDHLQKLVSERTAELEASEVRKRTILETVLSGIITIDAGRCIDTFNPAAEKLFGYTASEVKGRSVTLLMPPDIAAHHDGYMDRYKETGKGRIIGVGGREVTGRRKDGTDFPLELAVADMGQDQYVGVLTDITERKLREDDLKEARDAAEAANKIKMEFLAMMSHELKTPLAVMDNLFQEFGSIRMFGGAKDLDRLIADLDTEMKSEFGNANEKLLAEVEELSKEGLDAARRLLAVIQDTLDFSRIEAGKLHIEVSDLHLEARIEKAVREIRPLADTKGLDIVTRVAPLTVTADPHRFSQVMANLLSNAVKFTEQGRLTVTADADAGMAKISVRDTGCGIPPQKFSAVFSAFEQVDMSATRKHGGTGLGMPISRKLVKQMGGNIYFESEVGKGSVFSFTLPLADDDESDVKGDENGKRSHPHFDS